VPKEDVEDIFLSEMNPNEIKNYNYRSEKFPSKIFTIIVNFGEISCDFVVIFNNSKKK